MCVCLDEWSLGDMTRKNSPLFFAYAVRVRMFLDELDRVDSPRLFLCTYTFILIFSDLSFSYSLIDGWVKWCVALLKEMYESWSPSSTLGSDSHEERSEANLTLTKSQISVCHHITQALRDYFRYFYSSSVALYYGLKKPRYFQSLFDSSNFICVYLLWLDRSDWIRSHLVHRVDILKRKTGQVRVTIITVNRQVIRKELQI
jgi:hypothetical protein